ncbi:MAG: BrxA/BrxB family bacilliredoxin, partial [Bacteroidetes bacterium]
EYLLPYPPSSPAIALFKDGKLVHFLERHHIEGRSAEIIAQNLAMAFDRYC